MAGALLVSHDPLWALELARTAAAERPPVVLLDSAAAVARASHPAAPDVRAALEAGVTVIVHDDAAARRGIAAGELLDGVKSVDIDEIADLVAGAAGTVVWL